MSAKVHHTWRTSAFILAAALLLATWVATGYIKDHELSDNAQFEIARSQTIRLNLELADKDKIIEAATAREIGLWEKASKDSIDRVREKETYRRNLAAVRTGRYTAPQLDSTHLAMYGQVHTDTLHAIDLGVSRRLTGDALLVPVMKAHIEEQDHQYDSLKKNYSEIIGESKIQLEASGEKVRMLSELATMWETTAIEQNKARTEDEKRWKKKRTIERVIEGVIVVGVVILAL